MSDRQSAVRIEGVRKTFGDVVAVKGVDLDIEDGSFVTLLGPSGCGKTTILRMVAGLEAPTDGNIVIKGARVNEVPIHKRNLGLVFQNYALFPHKNVFDNIGFGLKYRGVEKAEITRRVGAALEIVRLPGVEKRLPAQLSGGQQQRIALARAIVIEPHVLLLDEPLSALDANLREQMRTELKNIQREIGVTTLFVTHDQDEALAMSDQVVVMDHGLVEQVGTPQEVYGQPATRFVADFLGQSNILPGAVEALVDGRPVEPRALATVNRVLRARSILELVPGDGCVELGHRHVGDPIDDALASVAEPLVATIAAGTTDRLRICANHGCRWVFEDTSRTRQRRWCSMASCGNRAKAARHRARKRATTARTTGTPAAATKPERVPARG